MGLIQQPPKNLFLGGPTKTLQADILHQYQIRTNNDIGEFQNFCTNCVQQLYGASCYAFSLNKALTF